MTTGNTRVQLGGRSRVIIRSTLAARLGLATLDVLGMVVPLAAAVLAALALDPQLAPGLPHWQRLAWTVTAAALVLSAVDSTLGRATHRLYQHLTARVHGPRTWSCEDCGAIITAARWSPQDAATYEDYLADPAAHGCLNRHQAQP